MMAKKNSNFSEHEIAGEQQRFITKVYAWMSFALIITGVVAMQTAEAPKLVNFIYGSQWTFFGLLMLQLILVAYLVSLVEKMSSQTATLVFILYAALNGLTLSAIFIIYTKASLATTFYVTAGTFGVMSIYGYLTKTDLTRFGNLLFMGLIGLIIASIANFFLQSEMLYWITTYAGVLIFVGLTAYDTQKIKETNIIGNEGTDEDKKEAIIGALTLYLDFINLFLLLLRLFGRRR